MSKHALPEGNMQMGYVKKAALGILAVMGWVEQNKVGLGAVGTAAGAVVNGLAHGVNPMTLALSVVAVFAAATHLSVTPLSNPKTYGGTPLVPGIPQDATGLLAPDPTP